MQLCRSDRFFFFALCKTCAIIGGDKIRRNLYEKDNNFWTRIWQRRPHYCPPGCRQTWHSFLRQRNYRQGCGRFWAFSRLYQKDRAESFFRLALFTFAWCKLCGSRYGRNFCRSFRTIPSLGRSGF